MAAKKALQQSGKFIPWQVVTVTVDGRLVEDNKIIRKRKEESR